MKDGQRLISGWGGTPRARTNLESVQGPDDIEQVLAAHRDGSRGVIARGLGRSYGDAAQRSGGTTLLIRPDAVPTWVDRDKGITRCSAGTSIGELIEFSDPSGFFVPVTPGTRHVTVGGAIAADIHGKDHHQAGSFGMHVERLRLLLADGEILEVTVESEPELFNATIGGMGLTGVILDADLRLLAVSGNRLLVDTFRTQDLDETMTALTAAESSYRYSVAWVDLTATRSRLGRGVVTNGNHVSQPERSKPLRDALIGIPPFWNLRVVNRATVRLFNEMWFRTTPARQKQNVQTYNRFFYPLDIVDSWYRAYGRKGFLQYQFVLPFDSEHVLPTTVETLARSPFLVSFAVLKRLGRESSGYLSFPRPGWTLAVDIPIPASPSQLELLLRSIDESVTEVGGRVYLAKDSRLRADLIPSMYPKVDRFRQVRDKVDPERLFRSDLSDRLEL